jgi:hypothetical protein
VKIPKPESTYNIVDNPIPKSGMWATYSLEELQTQVENLSGAERALAWHYVMLTLNACNKTVEDEILSKEIFAQ